MNRAARCVARRAAGRAAQRGAALLVAMLILTLVTTVAAAMVWRQHRAIEVEAAERARAQAVWILDSALDWARLILREDARDGPHDHLGEVWAAPLAEARLSSFLAADRQTNEPVLDAFLSGQIVDVQSRYNLRHLVNAEFKPDAKQLVAFRRLCEALGLGGDVATRIAEGLGAAWAGGPGAALPPTRPAHLAWLGVDAAAIERLAPYVVILPARTPVNANTAPREVLVAAIDDLDLGGAERIVQTRQRSPLKTMEQLRALLPPNLPVDDARVGIGSRFFEVHGQLRLEERVVGERSLVERRAGGAEVGVLQRERWAGALTPADAKR